MVCVEENLFCLPIRPVITQPISFVIRNKCVTVDGSISFSEIFFCVATTATSLPFRATDVRPSWLIDLKAYSVKGIKIYYMEITPRANGMDIKKNFKSI